MSKLKRPLDHDAVQKADDQFYDNHPEMSDENGKRIPLDASDPDQAAERAEWRQLYLANGGELEDDPAPAKRPDSPTQPCDKPKDKKKPLATLMVKWSKAKVTPVHNSAWPPASAPTDAIPDEAKVQLIGETTNVPDGASATMTIYDAATCSAVKDANLIGLEVKGNKVVDPATGKSPEWVFQAKHLLWDPWDKPYYYFTCQVDYQGLNEQTPKDFKGKEAACLRLIYWHECVAESSTLAGVLPEANTVAGILNGVANSKANVQNLTTVNIALAQYGSLLRNTYVTHQASHGNALNRTTGAGVPENDPGDTKYDKSKWRSVVHITPPPRFGDA